MTQTAVANVLTGLIIVALFAFFFLLGYQTERGHKVGLRRIGGFRRIRLLVRQSAENGTRVHFSPGTAGITGAATGGGGAADTLNGLTALEAIAEGAARTAGNITATTNDPLTLALAQNVVAGRYRRAGRIGDYDPASVRLVAPTTAATGTAAYIAGTQALMAGPLTEGSAAFGSFGDEYLLLGDSARIHHLPQVAGSTREQGMAVMLLTAGHDSTLLGEEVYAAPAYLDGSPAHIAAIRAQDAVRWLVIGGIIAVAVARAAGVF